MPTNTFISTKLYNEAQNLKIEADNASCIDAASTITLRLHQALNKASKNEMNRPLCIAFLGGTGVGKSELFNALIEKPDSSPVSINRPCTQKLYIAVSPSDRQTLYNIEDTPHKIIDISKPDLILIDTPDIDSIEKEHRQIMRKAIELADIIIYVTINDKRANYDIIHEVQTWSERKRWFFVMNKADNYGENFLHEIRRKFENIIQELSFNANENVCFIISAKYPEKYDFSALKTAVFSSRSKDQITALHDYITLNYFGYAVAEDVLNPVHEKISILKEKENDLNIAVQKYFYEGLSSKHTSSLMEKVVKERLFRKLPQKVGWLLYLPIWIRSRLSYMMLAFSLGRIATSGLSLSRLFRMGFYSLRALILGTLPLTEILDGFSKEHLKKLKEVADDAKHILEEQELMPLCRDNNHYNKDSSELSDNIIKQEKILPALEAAIESCAEENADKIKWYHSFFGNIIPAYILMTILYRITYAWITESWLDITFYIHAVMIFIQSLIPGLILIYVCIKSQKIKLDVNSVVASHTEPEETQILRQARNKLEKLYDKANDFRLRVEMNKKVIVKELSPNTCGAIIEKNS
ncbi:MAG: GTPase domain-containing protein [Desulfobacterales bacterium]|nr:GTPase domain-containing protein [Desulfobacterales bacterium]MBF0398530.1 GTPase domain-containing protein [Desulfobacterales bacterium]